MSYLHTVLSPKLFKRTVANLVKVINESEVKFDYILCTGISGIIVSGAVAARLKKNVLIIRKEREATHGDDYEYANNFSPRTKKFIIIDDGISSGKTIVRLFGKMNEFYKNLDRRPEAVCAETVCQGIFLYNQLSVDSFGISKNARKSFAWYEGIIIDVEETVKAMRDRDSAGLSYSNIILSSVRGADGDDDE